MAENVRGHLGVPETGLVAEMNAGLQHLAHGSAHRVSPIWVKPPPGRAAQRIKRSATLSAPGVWILPGTIPDKLLIIAESAVFIQGLQALNQAIATACRRTSANLCEK
jgi:hypothetical protein